MTFQNFSDFVAAHWGTIVFAVLYIFIGAVGTMPTPDDPRPFRTKVYQWFYDFLHLISNKAIEKNPKLAAAEPKP